jgi:hypothetical protein
MVVGFASSLLLLLLAFFSEPLTPRFFNGGLPVTTLSPPFRYGGNVDDEPFVQRTAEPPENLKFPFL